MGTRETRAARGKRLGLSLEQRTIDELRRTRMAAGISQRTMAKLLGWSAAAYWRFEQPTAGRLSVVDAATVAAILGLEASLSLRSVGVALRDKGHEALIARLIHLLSPLWRVTREALFPNLGDPRSWDLLLIAAGQRVGIEAETRIRDMQALVRRMRERARDGGADVLVLILSDSVHNRQLVADLRQALGPEFATAPAALLTALRTGSQLPGSGVVLL